MPLIQWIMQNLGMGKPVHNVKGSGNVYLYGTASLKIHFNYIASGSLNLSGVADNNLWKVKGTGGIKLAGDGLYLLKRSTTNVIIVVTYDVNPNDIEIIRNDLIDDLDIVENVVVRPDPISDTAIIRYIDPCEYQSDYELQNELLILQQIEAKANPFMDIAVIRYKTINEVNTKQLDDQLVVISNTIAKPDPVSDIFTVKQSGIISNIPSNLAYRLAQLKSIPIQNTSQEGVISRITKTSPVDTKRELLEAKLAALKEMNGI